VEETFNLELLKKAPKLGFIGVFLALGGGDGLEIFD